MDDSLHLKQMRMLLQIQDAEILELQKIVIQATDQMDMATAVIEELTAIVAEDNSAAAYYSELRMRAAHPSRN